MPDRMTRHNGIPEHAKWCDCLDCRTAWRLAEQDAELRQAKPATDAEWAAFFDVEYPRVKEGVS